MKKLVVDPARLHAIADNLGAAQARMEAAVNALRNTQSDSSTLGHPSLAKAAQDLHARWVSGIDRLSQHSAQMSDGLIRTAQLYAAAEGSSTQRFGVLG